MNMNNENVVLDFGNWIVPTSWEEVSVAQFQEIMKLSEKNEGEGHEGEVDTIDLISILTKKERKEVMQLPENFVVSIMTNMLFLNDEIDQTPSNKVTINGDVYQVNTMEKMKFGEYTDVNTIQKDDKYNYAAIMAILCRKKDEVYDDDYIADKLMDRVKMWENQPITKIMPIIGFFLGLSVISGPHSQVYLTNVEQTINQSLKDIEDFLHAGVGRRLSLKQRMIVWWKLRKLKKCMRRLS